jgi:competence protein ComEC
MNWQEVPFVRLLLPCLAGTLLANAVQHPIPQLWFIVMGSLLFLFLLIYSIRSVSFRWRTHFGMLLSFFLLLSSYHYLAHKRHQGAVALAPFTHKTVLLQGTIQAIKQRPKGPRLTLQVAHIAKGDTLFDTRAPILLYIPAGPQADSLQIGQTIQAKCQLSPLPAPQNPHAFDFRSYMAHRGIYMQAFVRPHEWQATSTSATGLASLQLRFAQSRRYALQKLRSNLTTTETFAVGSALLLGDKTALPTEIREAYANTGAMHVLAVSGLHVGIVYLFLIAVLRLMGIRERQYRFVQLLLVLAAIWSFALLTGGAPSVLRAGTMFSFVAIGKALDRAANIYNTLAASAFVLLLLDPELLFQVGFQLSYLAVIGIVFFQPRIYGLLFFQARLLDYAWQLTSVGIAAQLMTLPISLFYFHQFPTYFWLSGLIVIPAATLILGLGLLLFLSGLIPALEEVVGHLLYYVIALVNRLILTIEKLPFAVWEELYWSAFAVIVAYALLACWMLALAHKQFKWILAGLVLANGCALSAGIAQIHKHQTQQLVIYQIPKQTLIDINIAGTGIALQSDGLDPSTLAWSAQPYRQANTLHPTTCMLTDTIASGPIRYQAPVLQAGNHTMAILSPDYPLLPKAFAPASILVRKNAPILLEDQLYQYPEATFIFDGSNKTYQLKRWQSICETAGANCHFTPYDGAFQISIH